MLDLQALLILLLVFATAFKIGQSTFTNEEKNTILYNWIKDYYEDFYSSTARKTIFYTGSVLVLVAIAIGIVGAFKESFWLILACVIIEAIVFLLFLFGSAYGDLVTEVTIVIIGIILLILMCFKGKHHEIPFFTPNEEEYSI